MEEQRDEVQVTRDGVKIAGKDVNLIVLVLIAIATGVLLYMGWTHAQEQRDSSTAFVNAIKEQTTAIKESTIVQREANCWAMFKDAGNCARIR